MNEAESQAILCLDHLTSRLIFGLGELIMNRLREKRHENLRREINKRLGALERTEHC